MKLPDAEIQAFMDCYFKMRLAEMMALSVAIHDMQARVLTLKADIKKAA